MNEEIKMLEFELKIARNIAASIGKDLEDAREAFEVKKAPRERT